MSSPSKTEEIDQEEFYEVVSAYIAAHEPATTSSAKHEAMLVLINLLATSLGSLDLDDIKYLMVQVTFAFEHPLATISRLSLLDDQAASHLEKPQNEAFPAPHHQQSDSSLAPTDSIQPHQSGEGFALQPVLQTPLPDSE